MIWTLRIKGCARRNLPPLVHVAPLSVEKRTKMPAPRAKSFHETYIRPKKNGEDRLLSAQRDFLII